jgi:Rrf2 family iron-sulfur cluster assembly transcriptional regulator
MLTTKSRYAVMAIIDIATYGNTTKPINLSDIASRQNIATNYLEQIFNKLKFANLVKAIKGPGGGYVLNKNFDEFTIKSIIDAVEENLEMTRCGENEKGCGHNPNVKCSTHYLWEGLTLKIQSYLNEIYVSDLLSGKIKEQVLLLRNISN